MLDAITYGRDLFNSIASDTYSDDHHIGAIETSRKRYYSRLNKLIKMDLIKRKGGRYLLTTFGKVIYGLELEFGDAVDDHLKTKIQTMTIANLA